MLINTASISFVKWKTENPDFSEKWQAIYFEDKSVFKVEVYCTLSVFEFPKLIVLHFVWKDDLLFINNSLYLVWLRNFCLISVHHWKWTLAKISWEHSFIVLFQKEHQNPLSIKHDSLIGICMFAACWIKRNQ